MNSHVPRPSAQPDHDKYASATIKSLLHEALGLGVPALEARMLLAHVTGWRRETLIAFDDRALDADTARRFIALAHARAAGEPLAYLIGEREFHAHRLTVGPGVLIPRPETELLVDFAIEHAPPGAHVLDLGTGSGAIAVSIAAARTDLGVTACDISDDALAIARINNTRIAHDRVQLLRSDWYDALGHARFAVIISNPPYIAAGDPHLAQGDLRREPIGALTDHADGLQAISIIVSGAASHLEPGGWLAIEHGWDQAQAVRDLLHRRGFAQVATQRDLADIERMSYGRWAAPAR